MLFPILYLVLVIASWSYALRYGGRAALWAFIPFVLATAGTFIATSIGQFQNPTLERWEQMNWPLFASDSTYLIGILLVAYRFRRYWPIWSAGLQLMCVLTHFGPMFDHVGDPKIYRALETFWALPLLTTMVIGIAKDRRAGLR